MSAFLTTEKNDPLMVCLQSKSPHKTQWVAINFNVAERPTELFAALEAAGWSKNSIGSLTPLTDLPPINDRIQVELFKDGTAVFGGWTPTEKRAFRKELFAILTANGVSEYYEQKLSFADLI